MNSGKKLDVKCSPGTFKMVQDDEKYRDAVACHVAGTECYDEIVFSPQNDDMDEPVESMDNVFNYFGSDTLDDVFMDDVFTPLGDCDADNQYWSERSVKLMLALVEDLQPKVGKSIAVKTKTKMYKIVSERMAAEKHVFTPAQIQNKLRALERKYKNTVINNRQTGRAKQTCAYEKELTELLAKKKGINPEYTLESNCAAGKSRVGSVEEDISSDLDEDNIPCTSSQAKKQKRMSSDLDEDNIPCTSSQAKKQKRIGPVDAIANEMAKTREAKLKMFAEVQKKQEERALAKEEKARQKEERAKQKMELLKKLVEKITSK